MKHLLTIICCIGALSMGAQDCGTYAPDGDELLNCSMGLCCTVADACNGPNSPCWNYDPDFSATGGCDMSCVGVVCFDEEACNYGSGEECWYAEAGFDCEGYCLIDVDGDGDLESKCAADPLVSNFGVISRWNSPAEIP